MQPWPNGTSELSTSVELSASDDLDEEAEQAAVEQPGAVRIARRVLRTVIEQAALGVPGVARMATIRNGRIPVFSRSLPQHGVSLSLHDHTVGIDLYLIVEPNASMVEVGSAVQEAVGAAVEHILGMEVSEINVYIQDVA